MITSQRMKYVAVVRNTKASFSSCGRSYIGLEDIEPWTSRLEQNRKSDPIGIVSLYEKGDILFGKLRPYLAKVFLALESGACSTEMLVLKTRNNYHPPFLKYVLLDPSRIEEINSSTFGVQMPRASWHFIGACQVPLPDLATQKVIASYLDIETGRIDALIAKKQKLITVLDHMRSSTVSRAVSVSLDASVDLIHTRSPYLPKVPKTWRVTQLKHISKVRGGLTLGRSLESSEKLVSVPYLRVANVQSGWLDLSDVAEIDASPGEMVRYSLHLGDVLMNEGGDNDKLGRGAVWHQPFYPCLHQNHVFCVRPHDARYSE